MKRPEHARGKGFSILRYLPAYQYKWPILEYLNERKLTGTREIQEAGSASAWTVARCLFALKELGFIQRPKRGIWTLTEKGRLELKRHGKIHRSDHQIFEKDYYKTI